MEESSSNKEGAFRRWCLCPLVTVDNGGEIASGTLNRISIIDPSSSSRSINPKLTLGNLKDLPIDQIAQMAVSNIKKKPTNTPIIADSFTEHKQESWTGTDDFILDFARYELSAEELELLQRDEKRLTLYGKEYPTFAIVNSKTPVKKKESEPMLKCHQG